MSPDLHGTFSWAANLLQAHLPECVFRPGTSEYTQRNSTYYSAFNCEIQPACIILPSKAEDISAALKIIKENNVPFAVRGGGHTPFAGAANSEAVTIDMSRFKGIKINENQSQVLIGAGECWSEVYSVLAKQGCTVPGGRVASVGVMGLVTGGGLSYHSGEVGFVCDNVLEFEIVLASGEILRTSVDSHPKLFQALKGGSNSFGIVTRIKMRTIDRHMMWGGNIAHPISAAEDVLRAFCAFANDPVGDPYAHVMATVASDSGTATEIAMSGIWHTKPPSDCPPSFKPKSLESFEVIEPKTFNSVRVDSILSFSSELANWHSNGARQLFFTTSFRPKESLILAVYKAYRNSLRQAHDIKTGDLSFSLVLQCITPGMLAHSTRSGPNSLGLKPKDGPLAVVLLYPRWDSIGDDLIITKICEELIQSLEKLAVDADCASKYRFLNYAYGSQKVFEGYGDDSLRVLQEVSHTYDPYGLFQRNVSGRFKLREVSAT